MIQLHAISFYVEHHDILLPYSLHLIPTLHHPQRIILPIDSPINSILPRQKLFQDELVPIDHGWIGPEIVWLGGVVGVEVVAEADEVGPVTVVVGGWYRAARSAMRVGIQKIL